MDVVWPDRDWDRGDDGVGNGDRGGGRDGDGDGGNDRDGDGDGGDDSDGDGDGDEGNDRDWNGNEVMMELDKVMEIGMGMGLFAILLWRVGEASEALRSFQALRGNATLQLAVTAALLHTHKLMQRRGMFMADIEDVYNI